MCDCVCLSLWRATADLVKTESAWKSGKLEPLPPPKTTVSLDNSIRSGHKISRKTSRRALLGQKKGTTNSSGRWGRIDFDLKTLETLEVLSPQCACVCVKHTGDSATETKTQHGRRLRLLFSSQSALQLNEAIYSGSFFARRIM